MRLDFLLIHQPGEVLGRAVAGVGGQPLGLDLGGMTTQTFWRACPQSVKDGVAGIVLVDTTYQDPIQTMWLSPLWRALRWPLIEPMMWLSVLLSPLMWLSSWQGYLSGSNQLVMRLTGFGRCATRGQVNFTARLACKGSPGIQAKGNMAMFRWDASEVAPTIPVPVLILTGSRDIVTLPRASRTIVGAARDAQIVEVEGCGHMGFMERAKLYDAEIARFADLVLKPAVPVLVA